MTWSSINLQWDQSGQKNPPDLYAEWALLRNFSGFEMPVSSQGSPQQVELLVELSERGSQVLDELKAAGLTLEPIYQKLVSDQGPELLYVTALIERRKMASLWNCKAIKRWELGLAVERQAAFVSPVTPLVKVKSVPSKEIEAPCIAVIDFGCPFLHEQFRKGSSLAHPGPQTRIALLWDQSPDSAIQPSLPPPWRLPNTYGFGYGRVADKASIDQVLQQRQQASTLAKDELTTYARADYLHEGPPGDRRALTRTHGAHVLDLAAGSPDPLTGRFGDRACDAPIIFVHLPVTAAGDSTGGSLGVRVLDALHFIKQNTSGPVVVNLSYGTQAGPHDGSSLIEAAIDALCVENPRMTVVIAAGNAAQAAGHAVWNLYPKNSKASSGTVTLDLSEEDTNDGFVEFWYAAPAGVDVAVEVTAPGGTASGPLKPGVRGLVLGPAKKPLAALLHSQHVAGGANAMALLALAGRGRTGTRADGAPPGRWQLTVTATATAIGSDAPVTVHAWVERDDLPARSAANQLAFVEPGPGTPSPITPAGTLASLATGKQTIIVGARSTLSLEPLPYSSQDPTFDDRHVVSRLAEAEDHESSPGLRAAAVRSTDTMRAGGTSAAAAVATRTLFNQIP
jgi:hypothetical protein